MMMVMVMVMTLKNKKGNRNFKVRLVGLMTLKNMLLAECIVV